jgi:phage terminase large subunit
MFQLTTATRKISALTKRIRGIQGGTSASKTVSVELLVIDKSQRDEKPTLTSIVSESFPHLKRGAMRDFKRIMQDHRYWKDKRWNATDSTYTFETGSQVEFFSVDNADKVRGARRDRLFMNEANNISFETFQQLEVRTKEFVFLDWNPTTEFWFYTDVLGVRDDVDHLILNYQDNEALAPEIIRSIEQRKNNKVWWQVYGLGQLGEIETRIYTRWQIIDDVPHEAKLVRYGNDFGYTNDPTAIPGIYQYNGGYIIDEVAYQKGLSNKNIADIYLGQPRALVIADSSEPKSIDEIRSYGVPILPAEKGPGSVNQGIQWVQEQQISVTKRSINILKEYRNYVWITDRDGKILNIPIDINNHMMDAIRYALQSLKPKKPVTTPPAIGGVKKYFPELGF